MTTKPHAVNRKVKSAHIEMTGIYISLRWSFNGKREAIGMGARSDCCTYLLDACLAKAPKLELFALRRLLAADKSMRS